MCVEVGESRRFSRCGLRIFFTNRSIFCQRETVRDGISRIEIGKRRNESLETTEVVYERFSVWNLSVYRKRYFLNEIF